MTGPRVVVIGAGAHIFTAHLPGLRAIEARIVGVQDVDLERAERVAEELGCPAHDDVMRLLRIPADLAVIVSPHPFHAEHATACLWAGLHVLVEKPIALDLAEAEPVVREAAERGRLLCVGFQQRTRFEVQEARRLIRDGFLGKLQRADLLATWPRRSAYFQTAPWRGTWRGEGGGVLINQGQHDLDLLCYLAGRPSRVVAWTRTRLQPIETEDTVAALVEWPAGAIGSIRISTAEVDELQRIELTGTAGRMRLTYGRLELIRNEGDFRVYAASPGNPYEPPPVRELPPILGPPVTHLDLYRDFEQALAGAGPPIAPGSEALVTLELTNAITYSSLTGAEIELPLDTGAYRALLDSLRAASGTGE